MKRFSVLLIVLLILQACTDVCFASADFLYCTETFEDFCASEDGTAYPRGLFAQNFEGCPGGSGIYTDEDIYGRCIVIKTTENRGYTQLAYIPENPYNGTVNIECDIKPEDFNLTRSVQFRYNTAASTAVNLVRFEKSGMVKAGDTYISGFKAEASQWYHLSVSFNPHSGKVWARLRDYEREYAVQGSTGLSDKSVYSVWFTHADGAYNGRTRLDNLRVTNCPEPYDLDYHDTFSCFENSPASKASSSAKGRWVKPATSGTVTYGEGFTDEKGSCFRIVTKAVTSEQKIEYALRNGGYSGTIGYKISMRFEDFNNVRKLLVRGYDSGGAMISCELARISGGRFYWNGEEQPLVIAAGKWYDFDITYNIKEGIARLEAESGGKKCSFLTCSAKKLESVYRAGFSCSADSSSAENESVLLVDDVSVFERNSFTPPVYAAELLNNFDSSDGLETDGRIVFKNGESCLRLYSGQYINFDNSNTDNISTFCFDLYIETPDIIGVENQNGIILKIEKDGTVISGGKAVGKIIPRRKYRVFITEDKTALVRYTVISAGGECAAAGKENIEELSAIYTLSAYGGVAYIDNAGSYAGGEIIYPLSMTPDNRTLSEASSAEIVFPNFIDRDSLNITVNGADAVAEFLGNKTIRINNLHRNTTYHITAENARDMYGNYLMLDFVIKTCENITVTKIPKDIFALPEAEVKIDIK